MRPTSRLFPTVIALLPLGLRADLAGLAGLLAQDLAGVLDALLLVRIGHAQTLYLRGHLPDGLRVDLDRMREPETQLQLLPLDDRAEAGAGDLEVALVAGRDAGDHVCDERAREPVQGARGLLVVRARDRDRPVLALQ